VHQWNTIDFVEFSINITDEPVSSETYFVMFFLCAGVIASSRRGFKLPRFIVDCIVISAFCGVELLVFVGSWTWNIVYAIEISFGFTIFGPFNTFTVAVRFHVFE